MSALPPTPPLAALLGHAARSEHALPQQRSRVPSLSWVLAMPLCLDVPARAVAPAGAPRRARQIAAALLALAGVATVAWLLRPSSRSPSETTPLASAPPTAVQAPAPPPVAAPVAATVAAPVAAPAPSLLPSASIRDPTPAAKPKPQRSRRPVSAKLSPSTPLRPPTSADEPDLEVKCLAYPGAPACRAGISQDTPE